MSNTTIEYASNAPMPLILDAPSDGHASVNPAYSRLLPHHLLPDGTPDYLKLILTAKVYDILKETPLVQAVNLSARLGNEIWLKREDLQQVFSFKIRGAYNFMANLTEEERWRGVITCSAGTCYQDSSAVSRLIDWNRQPCTGCSALWIATQHSMHYRNA